MEIGLAPAKITVNGVLQINSGLQVTSGTPGVDKVLTSDATGNTSWRNFSTQVSAFQPLGCQSLATVTATYQKNWRYGYFY